jgi:hypothetical protein
MRHLAAPLAERELVQARAAYEPTAADRPANKWGARHRDARREAVKSTY